MATLPGTAQSRHPRSGGKILRPRSTVTRRTPYDRNNFSISTSTSTNQNPSWISRLMLPPRTIATGTVKLLSSVFGSSSSSSSSSDTQSDSEDDIDDNNDDLGVSSPEDETMDENNGTSEMITRLVSKPPPTVWKSKSKHGIEQLLLKETFSREECERLTTIIKSRVVDHSVNADTDHKRLNAGMPNISAEAVMEARKWLEEKKLGSASKSKLEHGTCSLNVAEGEIGSPVDVAKSYMQARPPWASPTMNRTELRSSSPIGIQLFEEDSPYSVGAKSLSSYKFKNEYLSSGSWNINEEIRRVRSKATEELLKNLPSSKPDWSAFSIEHRTSPTFKVVDELQTGKGEKTHGRVKVVDASLDLTARVLSPCDFPVSQMMREGLKNEASPKTAVSSSERNQDLEANQSFGGREGVQDATKENLSSTQRFRSEDVKTVSDSAADMERNTIGSTQPCSVIEGARQGSIILALDAGLDSNLHDRKCSSSKELCVEGGTVTSNGFPVSVSSLSEAVEREASCKAVEEETNTRGSDKLPVDTHLELGGASSEVPSLKQSDTLGIDSSCMVQEGVAQDLSQSRSKRGMEGKTNNNPLKEKEKEKETGKGKGMKTRRGRGRGK